MIRMQEAGRAEAAGIGLADSQEALPDVQAAKARRWRAGFGSRQALAMLEAGGSPRDQLDRREVGDRPVGGEDSRAQRRGVAVPDEGPGDGIRQPERAEPGALQGVQARPAAERRPVVVGQAADVGTGSAGDPKAEPRRRPLEELDLVDADVPGRPLDLDTGAGQLVEALVPGVEG